MPTLHLIIPLPLPSSQDGFTALYRAAQLDKLEIFQLLLDKGADVNKADEVNQALQFTSLPEPLQSTGQRWCARARARACVRACVSVFACLRVCA